MTDWLKLALQRKQQMEGSPALPPVSVKPPPAPAYQPPPPPAPATPAQQIDWVSRVADQTARIKKPMGVMEEETSRILSLDVFNPEVPRCPDPEGYGNSFLLPNGPHPDFRLRPKQIDAIWTYETYGGLFGPISVGVGKSLCNILSAIRAITVRGHYRVCIIVPSPLYEQCFYEDIPWARQRVSFEGVCFHGCEGDATERMRISKRSGSGVWIYKYSSLSTQTGYEELKAIRATAYFLDEAQFIARPKAARTKRFFSVLKELKEGGVIQATQALTGKDLVQDIEVSAVSGTLTKRSVKDYAHLAAKSLKSLSPTPRFKQAIEAYAAATDSDVDGSMLQERDAFILRQFIDWAKSYNFPVDTPPRKQEETDKEYYWRCKDKLTLQEQVRQAYMFRLRTCPGVVATEEQGVDSSLTIRWTEPKIPNTTESKRMIELMRRIVMDNLTPTDDVIDYAMHQYKWLWELSNGFYNNLIWPDIDRIKHDYLVSYEKKISDDQATALLNQAQKHHALLQGYHKALRAYLDRGHTPGCDSPMLVAQEIHRQKDELEKERPKTGPDLPEELVQAYWDQYNQGPHVYVDLPTRYSVPVRVCDYKLQAAADWAQDNKEGLIWYHHPEIGRWMSEILTERCIPHTFAPAGENLTVKNPGLVVASYAHGTGKNLQHQHLNYFLELRREASVMEQTLGRTHRSGQEADTVDAWISVANGFDLAVFGAILRDADYAQSTFGQQWRLCFADYAPPVPPTNPRLAVKLGITKNYVDAIQHDVWDQITPPGAEELAAVFRPLAYGK